MQELTAAERQLGTFMRGCVALYGAVGLVFLLLPNTVFDTANRLSAWLGLTMAPIPPSSERFWLALSFSLLVTLATLSFLVQRDVGKNKGYVVPILVSKVVSAACYLIIFLAVERHFIHLSAFLADAILFLVTWFFYRRALRST